MSAIKNVTVIGASGRLGSFILEKLLASNIFNVQVIQRTDSKSTYASGIKVVTADFESLDSLRAALQGQDAVVSIVGEAGLLGQKLIVDAAIAAGVKRFIPSDFGSNMTNAKSRALPVFAHKIAVQDYLIEKAATTQLTYTFVYNGAFTDMGIKFRITIDLSAYEPKLYNGGDSRFSSTSMPSIGDAVVGVLTHPLETRNRPVYVSETVMSQKQLVSIAQQIAPNKPWKPVTVELDPLVETSIQEFVGGKQDLHTALPMLLKSVLDPEFGALFEPNDNELLGIKSRGEGYLRELIEPLVK